MTTSAARLFLIFLRLGLTSFGGPIAHLGFFHDEFVTRRKWLDEASYGDLVALCQILPGPASSQVGIAVGLSQGGLPGALAAWLGFTLPSAVLMVLFAFGTSSLVNLFGTQWLHGLKIVAVAVVAQALWAMGTRLCSFWLTAVLAAASAVVISVLPSVTGTMTVLAVGAGAGILFLRENASLPPHLPLSVPIRRRTGLWVLGLFFGLLLVLPLGASGRGAPDALKMGDRFFRVGALVFGGGHVVLPLLQAEVVQTGWVSPDAFMAGYGAAQAVPGPLFSLAAYLGAVSQTEVNGVAGACLCLIAIFLPSFLLVLGVLPFWESWQRNRRLRRALQGLNAAVVGLLLAAFFNPVWTSAIFSMRDFGLAVLALLLLIRWKWPAWAVVTAGAVAVPLVSLI